MRRNLYSPIERLESRQFLSAALLAAAPVSAAPSTVPITVPTNPTTSTSPVVTGPTIHATAGTPFTGTVGFYATPVLDPPLGYFATINWGDGATSKAVLTYGTNGNAFGLIISGTHTYAKPGNFSARVTLVTGPINPKSALPTKLVEIIVDKVIVAPPSTSPGGVIIDATAGVSFTGVIGTFSFPAPGKGFRALVSWGDGTSSVGTVTPTGVSGLDVINYQITGTHTYKTPGTYSITILVEKVAKSPTVGAPVIVETIYSTADVSPGVVPVT